MENEKGQWNGLMGAMQRKEFHLSAAGFSMTAQRY